MTRRAVWGVVWAAGFLSACRPSSGSNAEAPPTYAPAASTAETAPGFSLQDLNGKTVSLSDFKGRVVFLDFWATWCPPCRASIPAVEALHTALGGRGVQFLGMNLDDPETDPRPFVEKKGMTYPVLRAGASDVSERYGVRGIPHFVVIDRAGRVARVWSGFAPGMDREWRRVIERLLAS